MWMSNAQWRWHDSCNGKITAEVSLVGNILERNRASTDTEWGVFSWPWRSFALGKDNPYLFVASNRYVQLKIHCEVVHTCFFAYKIIQLFSVVFCGVIAVHEIWHGARNKRKTKQMARWKQGMAVTDSHVFDSISTFSPYRRHDCRGTLPTLRRSTAFSWAKDVTRASHSSHQ